MVQKHYLLAVKESSMAEVKLEEGDSSPAEAVEENWCSILPLAGVVFEVNSQWPGRIYAKREVTYG
jgi:hypothetical protein